MSKRQRHLKQRLDELFSPGEEPEAADADVAADQADRSATPIGPELAPQTDRLNLRAVIDQLPLPAYVKDREHTWIAVNTAYGQLIGHDPATLIGHTDKEQADEAWQLDDRVLDTGQPAETQEATPLSDGSIRTRRIQRTALFNDQHVAQYVLGLVQEVAQRQQAEEDVSKFKLGIDRANAAVTITDAQGTIVYVNPAYEKIYGYTPAEAIGQNPRILKSGQVSPEEYQRFWAKLLAGESVTSEIINKAKDGRLVPVETNNTPILDERGKITGFLSIQYDITERRRAESDLQKFKLGLDRSNAAIFITDLNGTITYVNPAFEQVYGYRPAEAIGQTPRILKSGVIPPEQYQYFWQTLLAGQTVAGEIFNKAKDGRLVTIEGSNNPILDESGNLIGFLAMHTDITERKQTEAERERLLKGEAKRAVQLQTAAAISNAVSTVLDLDELLPFVVRLIQERFDLYYVGLFLLDGSGRQADLRAATGQAGRQLLAQRQHLLVDENSMIGWSILHRQARIALDVGDEAVRFNNPLLPNTRSEVTLPLISRGQVLGAMSAQSSEVAAFADQDVLILETMADQVATAIANASLIEQAEARLREVQFLQAVGQAVSSTLDLTTVLDVIFQTLEKDMGFTHAALALADSGFKTITHVRASGTAIGLQGLSRTVEQLKGDILFDILQKGKTEVIDGWDDRLDREIWDREGHAALVRAFVPLLLRGEPVGILEVGYWRTDRPQMTSDEVRLLDGMADQMAIAVGNARLFDDSQRRITELAVVNEISRALTATSDLGQLFVTIHEQVGRLFEASNFYIATYDGGDEWSLDYQIEHSELQPTAKHKLGRGVTSHILRTKQSLLMRSVQDYLAVHEMYDIPKIGEPAKSWMGVPLIVAGNVTGVMGIQSYDQEWLYSEQNVALFSTIGTQVAAAIQNARLLQEARVRANELASLNELSRTLASQLSVQQVLEEVWHGVSHLLDTTNFYIALYDAERQEISFPINASESVLDKEITVMPASQGLTGHLIRTRQPLLIKEDVQHMVEQLGLANVGANSQSYLGVPIAIGDQVLGAIAIQSYTTARSYNEHDQDLLVAIAGQTAIALQNARLFEQTKRQASEAAALSEIMRDISQRVDLEFVLETAYRHIRQLLPTDVFLVALLEGERQLRYPLIYDEGQRFPSRGGEVRPETNIGRVILEGKSLLVIRTPEELDAEAGSMAVSVLGNTQRPSASLLYVPLTAEQKTVGALSIQSYEMNAYSPDNVVLMERIASQVAIAIQNALLFEETSQRNAELATLNQITSSASQTLDLRALLDMVLTQTLKDFGFDGGLVTVYNETRHKLERVVRTGLPGRIPDDPAEGLENSLCAYVFNSQEPLVIEDFRQGGPIDVSGEVEAGYLSYIGIPIEAKGRTLGTWCGFRKSPGAFGKNTLTLLQTVGHQVGFAIENAQFFAQTQATLAETEQLYAASQRLTAATTLQEAVAAMAEGVPVTDINRAVLWLFERDEQGQVAAAIVSAGWYSGQGVPVMPTGTRLSSEVIKAMPLVLTTEPLFSGDLKTDRRIDPSTAALLQQQRIGAIAILPLWATGRQIGAFLLEAEGPHTFTDAEIRPYTSLAQQLATTIYNQQLLEQTQRNTQQLTILNELGRDLSQEIELDSVLNATFRNLQRLLPLDAYLVGLREGDTDVITYPVVYDDGQWYEPTTGSLSSPTTTTQVIITGKPVLKLLTAEELADQSEVAGAMGDVNRPSASLLYAPLQIGPRTIGVLSVQSYQLNAYTSEHVQIVGSVASQVAVAIQNARLFEQVQRTARREQTLRELTARVRSSSDPDTIVRTAVRELGLALGRQTFIRLGDAAQLTTPPAPPATFPVFDNGSGTEAEGRKVRTGGQ